MIVTYESAGCIERCLTALRAHLDGCELIVVDNASSDGTGAAARRVSGTRVIDAPANLGFGRACNLGARAASGSHLLFVNPDVTVERVDLDALVRFLGERPFGIGVPLLSEAGRLEHQVYAHGNPLLSHLAVLLRPVMPRELTRTRKAARDPASGWIGGAMFLVARSEFESLGGFDPRFFLYLEDRDLSRRYRAAGLPTRTTAALAGAHVAGGSSSGDALRPDAAAWMHLGWLQYLFIWHGRRAAELAARVTLGMLRAELAALRLAAILPASRGRAARKRRQLDAVRALLLARAFGTDAEPSESASCCPDARAALRRAASRSEAGKPQS